MYLTYAEFKLNLPGDDLRQLKLPCVWVIPINLYPFGFILYRLLSKHLKGIRGAA
jgi:hypothetical protein